MNTIKNIFFSLLGILAVGMLVFLGMDIYEENARIQRIKGVDAKVIKRLEKIRLAQEAHLSVKKTYCNSWDSLTNFIANDKFVIVQIKETIKTENGKDQVIIAIDTLARIAVFDSLKTELEINSIEQISSLWRVPVSDTIFTIRADKLGNGQQICEIRDPYPLNPKRQEEGSMKPLQIGSLEISTLQGNWE